MAQKNSKNNN